jgi:lantibiotic modifying enzyme
MAIATGWERATQDLVARLAASEAELIAVFFSDRHPGPLTDAKASGDTHGRGQAVSVLTFASGAQLVYKPRPMAMERGYYGLIQWLNEHGLEHGLKVVRTLDEGAFGWMQFIPVLPCANRTEVERFFARMGAQFDREL